jgi:hypothetical protein
MRQVLWILTAAALAAAQDKQAQPPTPPNVELTVYLLSGATVATGTDDVPQDLASTVRQLHGVFTYKSYKLAESFVLRGRSSSPRELGVGAQTQGILPGSGLHYLFEYRKVDVSAEKPRMVHIDGLQINLSTPPIYNKEGKQRSDIVASISTGLDLADGQKTVVGKSSINNAGDALILVIVPKVIE